jgi:hypothetical protein
VEITCASSRQSFGRVGGTGWSIQADLHVTNNSTAPIQLVGISLKISDTTQMVSQLPGSIGPWRAGTVLGPGRSVQTSTSVVASNEAGSVILVETGGWVWPDCVGC